MQYATIEWKPETVVQIDMVLEGCWHGNLAATENKNSSFRLAVSVVQNPARCEILLIGSLVCSVSALNKVLNVADECHDTPRGWPSI